MRLADVQAYMREQNIGGWLVHDFRGSNAVLARLLPPDPAHNPSGKRFLTRRADLWIPASGSPALLSHGIDRSAFEGARLAGGEGVSIDVYLTWQQWRGWLERQIGSAGGRIAMEYAPGGGLPVVGTVDAGTIELVRGLGAEVVSSANLVQVCIARWSEAALESHEWASREVARVKDEAFSLIRERRRTGTPVSEWEVVQAIHANFKKAGLEWPDGPIVGVNAHGADPHFETTAECTAPIRPGDWILLDLWARRPGEQHIFSDITWVAYAERSPGEALSARHARVFDTVKAARDASVALAQKAWRERRRAQGWELDDAAREQIVRAGYGEFIRHRTGHSLSAGPMVHGVGVNIDNLETHDTREVLPGVGYTVEPGVYIPDGPDGKGFGVRLEINVYADPETGPRVTSCVQNEVVRV